MIVTVLLCLQQLFRRLLLLQNHHQLLLPVSLDSIFCTFPVTLLFYWHLFITMYTLSLFSLIHPDHNDNLILWMKLLNHVLCIAAIVLSLLAAMGIIISVITVTVYCINNQRARNRSVELEMLVFVMHIQVHNVLHIRNNTYIMHLKLTDFSRLFILHSRLDKNACNYVLLLPLPQEI